MDHWITILTFNFPTEAHLAKSKLESEGIEVLIRDELMAQIYNFNSPAIGGVKLEIREEDLERAMEVLKDTDYLGEPSKTENKYLELFDSYTAKLPLIGKTILEFRIILFIALLLCILVFSVIVLSLPG